MYLEINESHTCCFIGHRQINHVQELKRILYGVIEKLIIQNDVRKFLFGSKSEFNDLCYEVVTQLKGKYPDVVRVYVRAEFPVISEDYRGYLLERYEDTYYPECIIRAGRAVYAERNCVMIESSHYCVVFYDGKTAGKYCRKSGTKIALDYAALRNREIINIGKWREMV